MKETASVFQTVALMQRARASTPLCSRNQQRRARPERGKLKKFGETAARIL